jgi:hypothetical protein
VAVVDSSRRKYRHAIDPACRSTPLYSLTPAVASALDSCSRLADVQLVRPTGEREAFEQVVARVMTAKDPAKPHEVDQAWEAAHGEQAAAMREQQARHHIAHGSVRGS